ncbi:hypothetical protein DZC75_10565 [Pseudomonas parafulva]|uniref:Lipoprotein n=1 Tax=Pseudomonas parafulva TaxID=157782 RepID=A0AAI8KB78_9PSED|nr:hypothetical protein DZC75_10565 [Pseudomonas parafulva]
MNQNTAILLLLVLTGCSSAPTHLSDSAKLTLNAPMPTSEAQRLWDCAGTTNAIAAQKIIFRLQGRPYDWGGDVWALSERAKRVGCTQAEMDARDMGRFSDPVNWPEPGKIPRPK